MHRGLSTGSSLSQRLILKDLLDDLAELSFVGAWQTGIVADINFGKDDFISKSAVVIHHPYDVHPGPTRLMTVYRVMQSDQNAMMFFL